VRVRDVLKQKDNMAVFAGGQLKPVTDKEASNRRRKWALPGSAQGAAVYIGDKSAILLFINL